MIRSLWNLHTKDIQNGGQVARWALHSASAVTRPKRSLRDGAHIDMLNAPPGKILRFVGSGILGC